jgi:hypothetical protein
MLKQIAQTRIKLLGTLIGGPPSSAKNVYGKK